MSRDINGDDALGVDVLVQLQKIALVARPMIKYALFPIGFVVNGLKFNWANPPGQEQPEGVFDGFSEWSAPTGRCCTLRLRGSETHLILTFIARRSS
jgi:hypothetical protein